MGTNLLFLWRRDLTGYSGANPKIQSTSVLGVLNVTRLAAVVPLMSATGLPLGSYCLNSKLPLYDFPLDATVSSSSWVNVPAIFPSEPHIMPM